MHLQNCHLGRRISKRFTVLSALFAGVFALVAGSVSTYAFVRLQNGVLGLYWANGTRNAIFFTISTAKPCPGAPDGSADAAVRLAFDRWQTMPSTTIRFQEDQRPDQRARTDWQAQDLHLVWFDTNDSSGMFSANSGLVAVTPVNFAGDGSILDADIIFNAKDHEFSTTQKAGTFDVQNIATHEVGHFLGLDHSAIVGATMNPFAIQQDVRLRSLEKDDTAGCSTVYPNPGFSFGSISGRLLRANGSGISGAHVVAENARGEPASSTLTTSDGHFQILGLEQGQYHVYAEPLDGPVVGQNLSLGTSNLKIDTDFGTTFLGNASNPTGVNVSPGSDAPIGNIAARTAVGLTIQGSSPSTVIAGDQVSLSLWGSGFDSQDRVLVTGDGFTIARETIGSTSITILLSVDPGMSPTVRSLRLVRTSGDSRVLSGGLEVRLAAPALSGLTPGKVAPGATVTLKGANLRSGGVVIVGSEMVKNPSATGDTVVFPCPPVTNGVFDVTYQNDDGQMAALTQALTVAGSQVTASSGGTSTETTGTSGSSGGTSTTTSQPSGQQASAVTGFTGGGGGGGGGGGCEVERSSRSPAALLPLVFMLLIVARRRTARSV